MFKKAIATLQHRLSRHMCLSNSRVETFCFLVLGMVNARTINLSHLACEFSSSTKVWSNYRRLQRFFQFVDLGADWAAPLVVRMIGACGPWHLCLDRTNWKVGQRHVNILVLAIVTRRHRVPLMWSVLGRSGSSSTAQRIALIQRYLSAFKGSTIKYLLADREFIGALWLDFLNENNIPFIIRVKANQSVTTQDGQTQSLHSLLRTCRGPRTFIACFGSDKSGEPIWFTFAAKRIKGRELLIVVSNRPAHHALTTYKKDGLLRTCLATQKHAASILRIRAWPWTKN